MTLTVTPDTRETPAELDVLATYRRHFGGGRASVGQLLGGMVEVGSSGAWIDVRGRPALPGLRRVRRVHPRPPPPGGDGSGAPPARPPPAGEPDVPRAGDRPGGGSTGRYDARDLDLVHFVNSGAEATEAALKLARIHGRTSVITTSKGYHGKTLGALSVTANPTYQDPFRPLLPDITAVPYGDAAAMAAALRATHGTGRGDPRAGAGRRRRRDPAARLPARGRRPVHRERRDADRRRDPDRHGPAGHVVGHRGRAGRARHPAGRQGPVRRGRAHRGDGGHPPRVRTVRQGPLPAHVDLRRVTAGLRRGGGHDRRHPRRAHRRARGPHRGAAPPRDAAWRAPGCDPPAWSRSAGGGCCSASSSRTLEPWASWRCSCSSGECCPATPSTPRASCASRLPPSSTTYEINQFLTSFSAAIAAL